ncbi:MAG: HDOD domain-containing protein [Phycisphaerales bacterium]
MASVRDVIRRLDELPALPESLVRVRSMLAGGDYNVAELGDVVKRDEALAAVVLRCANSAFYKSGGSVFDLNQSIVRLGASELMRLVTRTGVSNLLESGGRSYGLRRGHLSRSAVGGAVIARTLASEAGGVDPELAYTCALLRDVGKLVIDLHCDAEGIDTGDPDESENEDVCFLGIEKERFGFDHTEVGSALTAHWGLPEPIPASVAYHHSPPEPGAEDHAPLFDIVHAADIVTLWAGLAIGRDGLAYRISTHVRDGMLRNRERIERLISEAWDAASRFEQEQNDSGTDAKGVSA